MNRLIQRTAACSAREPNEPEPGKGRPPIHDDWLLWQLADSAFPTGGFAHSAGLEAAWQHGEVRQGGELVSFCEASLDQVCHSALPLLDAAHREPGRAAELDRVCEAFTSNHVANRASRLQGRALRAAAERIFGLAPARLPFVHHAPVFGLVTRQLELTRPVSRRLFLFAHLRSVLAAAVRLGIVGPMESQGIQFQLSLPAQALLIETESLGLEDLAQTSPLLDLWQGAHDRMYSRLFQS